MASRARASDFIGSATILVTMNLHLEHSKMRFSEPSLLGSDRASAIRVLHRMQRGHSISASEIRGDDFRNEAITLT